MHARKGHLKLLWVLLSLTLTCAAPDAFPAPKSRAEAVAGLKHASPTARAEALAWLALNGQMADQPLLVGGLRDADKLVRDTAEQSLWVLWGRSGEAALDKLLAEGVGQMQTGRFNEALATFSEVIRRKPAFAEGWNKRATLYFLAGDYERSLADCDEVLKRNPQHFGALSGCGQILFRMERLERALEYWKRAVEVNPNMPGVEVNIEIIERLLKERKGRSA
jgi:tetratricopeptide (TPR) repeat protein